LQLLGNGNGDFKTWTRWGRVGDRGQSAILGNGTLDHAITEFDSKFKSKSGLAWKDRGAKAKAGKYTFIERSYADDSDDDAESDAKVPKIKEEKPEPPESTLDPTVQELMGLIFNQEYFAGKDFVVLVMLIFVYFLLALFFPVNIFYH
jgi:poly [ADP-ribose] polymerase